MNTTSTAWVPGTSDDAPAVLALMRDFYAEEKLPYVENLASRVVAELLSSPSLGVIFICRSGTEAQGYVAATLCYSLEFGGHYALLDELYLGPGARGRGESKRAITCVESWARDRGVATVRLEVNHDNEKALSIYLKSGFTNDHRHMLSKRLG